MLEFELVVPAYNEAKSLPALVETVVRAAQCNGFTPDSFQFVVVENGSTDNSYAVLEILKASMLGAWFRIEKVVPNQGYGHGLWSGLQSTRAKFVGWSHADLQCDPNDAFKALELLKRSPDAENMIVKGVRTGRSKKDIIISRGFELFAFIILGAKFHEINAQPKVFPRHLLDCIIHPPQNFAFDLYVLYCAARIGFHCATIPVFFPPRIHGASKWAANLFSRYKTILGMIRYMWFLMRTVGRL